MVVPAHLFNIDNNYDPFYNRFNASKVSQMLSGINRILWINGAFVIRLKAIVIQIEAEIPSSTLYEMLHISRPAAW